MKKIIYPTLIIILMLALSTAIIITFFTCLSLWLYCLQEGQWLNGWDFWWLVNNFLGGI